MAGKRCNSSELLIRIDERMRDLKEVDIPEIKVTIKEIKSRQYDMKEKLNKDHYRIETLEKDVNKSFGFNIFKVFKLFLKP